MTDPEHRIGRNLIPVIAYGDAAGLPYESRSADDIKTIGGVPRRLVPPKRHAHYAPYTMPAGTFSDDTQLSVGVALGLLDENGFSLTSQAEAHIEVHRNTQLYDIDGDMRHLGWGKNTGKALDQLIAHGDPAISGIEGAAGNGVLMKLAPLAYWQAMREVPHIKRHDQYDALTNLTHRSSAARLTTRVHGDILTYLMGEEYTPGEFIQKLEATTHYHQRVLGERVFEGRFDYLHGELSTRAIIAASDAKGFYAPETLVMAYGAFMHTYDAPLSESIYSAIELGGDTDSLASIVGTMHHMAHKGAEPMPADIDQVEDIDFLRRLSHELATRA